MFHPDVISFREFYKTPLGQVVRQIIFSYVESFWPARELIGQQMAGIGYALPYLESEHALAFMPARMGVLHWPAAQPNRACLVDEQELPLCDSSLDRFLVVHALEQTEQVQSLMQEAWRVLVPGGKLLMIVPNRLSIWSRLERSPFGEGRPFTGGQLQRLLEANRFSMATLQSALFMPPLTAPLFLRAGVPWERFGRYIMKGLGGVWIVQAEKQIYALTGKTRAKKISLLMPEIVPVPLSRMQD